MREILFRGKSSYTGVWVEGYFSMEVGRIPYLQWLEAVILDTVGEYTGLTDKNGKKIFEGDILRYSEQSEHFRYLNNVCFAVFYDNLNACFAVERYVNGNYECKKRLAAFNPSEHLEVIGNIHDNPELLEGE